MDWKQCKRNGSYEFLIDVVVCLGVNGTGDTRNHQEYIPILHSRAHGCGASAIRALFFVSWVSLK